MELRYPGLIPSKSKDGKYSVVHDGDRMAVRLIHQLGQRQWEVLAAGSHDPLIHMVNAVKVTHRGEPGGAFYINEYQHVIVPTEAGTFFAGIYEPVLKFDCDGIAISPRIAPGLQVGGVWPGPHVGICYVLAKGGSDIYYKRHENNRQARELLSTHVGAVAASQLAARLAATKGSGSLGGTIYINECREFFGPVGGNANPYIYLGALDPDEWFPEPEVPGGGGHRRRPSVSKTEVQPGWPAAKTEVQPNSGDTRTAVGEVLPAPTSTDVASLIRARPYEIGDTINDRFTVEKVLGRGGFSTVYRVRDSLVDRILALKLFETAEAYDAVRREFSALLQVKHPNVVEVIWADSTDAGEWYIIMEFVEGELLADYATGKKQLRDREAIDVALDILSALIAIHPGSEHLDELDRKKREGELTQDEFAERMRMSNNGLVHRDIKPQNVMLTRSGAKLLDFNISSRVGDRVETVSGTFPYQPPDAALTHWDVSPDLFAVGVTLYELLCDGKHPYEEEWPMLDVEPRDPRQFRKDMREPLAEFLIRACASDRSTRFQTASQMKSDLETVRASL